MHLPSELILRDVRCFAGEQRAPLRPLTLLVGENSTGKTSFLGCYAALHRALERGVLVGDFDFNEEPFSMGSFRDIVRSRRGSQGAIKEFRIGLGTGRGDEGSDTWRLTATFSGERSEPTVQSWRYDFSSGAFLELRRADEGTTFAIEGYETKIAVPFTSRTSFYGALEVDDFIVRRFPEMEPIRDFLAEHRAPRRRGRLRRQPFLFPPLPRLVPVAPLRAKPKRTYDPVRETATPEGEHIPMLMMRLEHTEGEQWQSLREDLVAFGKESGLFSDIRVKRHGKQLSDSFQLQVKVHSGSLANLMDVGYGVSQSLPILVELLTTVPRAPRRQIPALFLLQQPEVHLHPRGQAELASFLVNSVEKRSHSFLVETHSDHIVDRIRIAVREKRIAADKVGILFFEPQRRGNAVSIHEIRLDAYGNIEGAPAGYRDFFLRETDRLLGFDG